MGTIEDLLKSELEKELEALGETQLGSDTYKVAIDGVTKLMDRHIEISKLIWSPDVESKDSILYGQRVCLIRSEL